MGDHQRIPTVVCKPMFCFLFIYVRPFAPSLDVLYCDSRRTAAQKEIGAGPREGIPDGMSRNRLGDAIAVAVEPHCLLLQL